MQIPVKIFNVCCLVLTVYATGENIVVPPSDTTGLVGGSAQISCEVKFGPTQDLTWEHNENYIYSYAYGEEEYPQGRSKYEVRRSGSTFHLEIKMLNLADSGIIICNCFADRADAVLIVIANPILSIYPKDPGEGDSATITCDASFGGPRKELISLDHFPELEMYFEDKPIPAATIDEDKNSYYLHKIYNLTVESGMNGDGITCMIQTRHPALNATQSSILEVLYSVRNITYTPQLTQYEVGSQLTCTAQGNPPPIIEWDDIEGMKIQGKQLQITESMVGPNQWNCTARNIIRGRMHEESKIAEFAVVKVYDYETEPVDDSKTENNSSKYWIILPIAGLAVGIGAFLFVKKRKQRRSETTTDSVTRVGETSNEHEMEQLLTEEDELNQAECLEKYFDECKRLAAWCYKMNDLIIRGEVADIAAVEVSLAKHQEHRKEIDTHHNNFNRIKQTGQHSISLNHYQSDKIQSNIDNIEQLFEKVSTTWERRNNILVLLNDIKQNPQGEQAYASLLNMVHENLKTTHTKRVAKAMIAPILIGMGLHKDKEKELDFESKVRILLELLATSEQKGYEHLLGLTLLQSLAYNEDPQVLLKLGNLGVIETMLDIIGNRLNEKNCDEVMELAWMTMIDCTDETPANCEIFIRVNGMNAFLQCFKVFQDEQRLLEFMIVLMGNVSEVKSLRCELMKPEYVNVFSALLDPKSDDIKNSCHACEVLIHLVSDEETVWAMDSPSLSEIQDRISYAIHNWNIKGQRDKIYSSLGPIIKLLGYDKLQAKHFAIWVMLNLTTTKPQKYCPMVEKEGALNLLKEMVKDSRLHITLKDLASKVIDICKRFNENPEEVVQESLE